MPTALQLGVALKALLLHQGFAVLGASGEAAPTPASVSAVAEGLRASGAASVAGSDLRRELVGDAEPLGEITEAHAALYARVLAAYDEGAYADAARDAEAAFQSLDAAPPCTRREALARQVQLVWGASLVELHQAAAARTHFRWALERDPFLIADRDRFPPPIQRAFEHERTALASDSPSRLVVAAVEGTPGAGLQLIVDGLPRGALPRELSLPAHTATLWVEGGQPGGWAHRAVLAPDHTLSIELDLALEAALIGEEGRLLFKLPASAPMRRMALGALMARSRTSDVVVVSKAKPSGATQQLSATRFNAEGVVVVTAVFDADEAASASVARTLRGLPAPAAATAPVAGVEKEGDGFPVLPVVLGAAGVVAVAAILTAVFWPHSFEVTLTPGAPR